MVKETVDLVFTGETVEFDSICWACGGEIFEGFDKPFSRNVISLFIIFQEYRLREGVVCIHFLRKRFLKR